MNIDIEKQNVRSIIFKKRSERNNIGLSLQLKSNES